MSSPPSCGKIPWMEEPGRLQSMGSLSRTRLSNFTFTFCFPALEKEMATHSSAGKDRASCQSGGAPALRPGAIAQSPGRPRVARESWGWRSSHCRAGRLQSLGSLSRTRLSNFTFTFHFHALEKEMATHSSVLAWRIPGTAGPGGLPSMELHRVRHD